MGDLWGEVPGPGPNATTQQLGTPSRIQVQAALSRRARDTGGNKWGAASQPPLETFQMAGAHVHLTCRANSLRSGGTTLKAAARRLPAARSSAGDCARRTDTCFSAAAESAADADAAVAWARLLHGTDGRRRSRAAGGAAAAAASTPMYVLALNLGSCYCFMSLSQRSGQGARVLGRENPQLRKELHTNDPLQLAMTIVTSN